MSEHALPATATPTNRDAHRGRLFRKYLLLILTLVTGALLTSGAISIYFSYQEIKTALSNLQHEKAVAAASRIEQYIHQIEQQLAYAALPQLDAADVELRRIEFLKLLRQAPEVTDIAQLDANGREQIAVSRLGMDIINSGKDRSQEPAFRNARRGKPWFGPVYFRKETEPYMTIAIRSGSEPGPVTVADVNLKFIWDVVSRIKIGDKGKAYVVDRNGFLIADPDIGLVLRKTDLSNLPHVKAAHDEHGPGAEAMLSKDLTGTEVLTSVATIEPLAWSVFVEQPVRGGVREAVHVDPAHRTPAAGRSRDLGAGRAGARARHGAADPHSRRRRAAHRRRRPRPEDRHPHRRRAGGARRPVQPHDRAIERVVRGTRAQGRRAHARAHRIRSSSRRRSARSCA